MAWSCFEKATTRPILTPRLFGESTHPQILALHCALTVLNLFSRSPQVILLPHTCHTSPTCRLCQTAEPQLSASNVCPARPVSSPKSPHVPLRFVEPDTPRAGDKLKLFYNRKATSLSKANINSQDVSITS